MEWALDKLSTLPQNTPYNPVLTFQMEGLILTQRGKAFPRRREWRGWRGWGGGGSWRGLSRGDGRMDGKRERRRWGGDGKVGAPSRL